MLIRVGSGWSISFACTIQTTVDFASDLYSRVIIMKKMLSDTDKEISSYHHDKKSIDKLYCRYICTESNFFALNLSFPGERGKRSKMSPTHTNPRGISLLDFESLNVLSKIIHNSYFNHSEVFVSKN